MPNKLPSVTIEGTAEFAALLKNLSDNEMFSAVQKGMRAVGTKLIRDARRHLSKNHGVDTGQLKKSLGVRKVKAYKKDGRVVMYIGPRGGFSTVHPRTKKKHNPFFIAHLVEFGHRIAVNPSSGRSQKDYVLARVRRNESVEVAEARVLSKGKKLASVGGAVRERPFLRPAVDANRNEFTRQMTEKLREVLIKARAKRG